MILPNKLKNYLAPPVSPPPVLKTEELVASLAHDYRAYNCAAQAMAGKDDVIEGARETVRHFELARVTAPADVARIRIALSPGASLSKAKLRSIGHRIFELPEYQHDPSSARSFLRKVFPAVVCNVRAIESLQTAARILSTARSEAAQIQEEVAYAVAEKESSLLMREERLARAENKATEWFGRIPRAGVLFEAGGETYHVSKEDLQKSPSYLSTLASGRWTVYDESVASSHGTSEPPRLHVSSINGLELRALTEFISEGLVRDFETYMPERLLDVAIRFGPPDMATYVANFETIQAYNAERT